uniref:Uncharacterized protein n=1 Tax=Chromera velia CCMP2878 TaxID=1169474 RepID=A0A0G4GVQ5_9ALVE|eukprot:Cvel_23565.t1-p1 / transcript=Cvel_23565.t1 / gene=Cvel_23565 / organism=Chromera_velia_CCMP2878 / gene_product=Ankyrin-1, putative / transcript_product=Ankyrin-1, putative / location=Cvel_scaffold2443:3101-10020(+) / protein_length=1576 / sequence_SO=supercontig / SO=protein_coding / is_pseudo=false
MDASGGGGRDPVTGEERNRTALFLAAIVPQREGGGDVNRVVDPLLQWNADLSKRDYEGATVLHAVAGSCELQRTRTVLRQAARDGVFLSDLTGERDGRTRGSLEWTVLHTAAKKNCANLVPLFLEQGGSQLLATRQDAYGLTAFHVAARFGSADVVSAFLEGGQFDVESRTGPASEGRTAFHLAAEGSSLSDPSFRGEGHRLAKSFSLEEQLKTLRVLATHNASATAMDARGFTPLHAAAQAGRAGAVRFLVDVAGVDVDVGGGREPEGVTPLMLAVQSAQREAVEALLHRNASLFEVTERGQTPLHFVAVAVPPPNTGGQGVLMVAEMARRLVQAIEGPSLRVRALSAPTRDWRAEKPLHLAVRSGSAELVRALVEEEVEARKAMGESERVAVQRTLESPDGRLQTPILAAASEGRVDILSLLLSKGARVGVRGEGGKSLLHMAVESGFVEVVRRVLSISDRSQPGKEGEGWGNASITTAEERGKGGKEEDEKTLGQNPTDWSGASPLHTASSLGREDIVALLCDNGAEPNSERADAVTPLLLAARRGSLSALRRLASCGARGVAAVLVDPSVPADSLSLLTVKNESESLSGQRELQRLSVGEDSEVRLLTDRRRSRDRSIVSALQQVSTALMSEGVELSSRVDEEAGEGGHRGTALQVAASQGLTRTSELLLEWGASVKGPSRSASSSLSAVASLPPLLLAASGGWEETARLLVREGADVRARGALSCGGGKGSLAVAGGSDSGANERTALHCAAALNLSELVTELLKRGADVNAQDGGGRTPLLLAARSLSVDSLRELLQSDEVDLSVMDRDRKHAYSLAAEARKEGGESLWEERRNKTLQMLKEEDEKAGGKWNDCEVFKSLCKDPLICEDPNEGLWSRETTVEELCRQPTEWELLVRVVRQQVDRVLLIGQLCVLGVLLVAAVLIVCVIPRWKEEWKDWEMRFPPLLGVILQLNNLYTDVILIVLVGAAAVRGVPAAVGLFAVSLVHAVVVIAFNAFSMWRFHKVTAELQKEPWWAEVRHKPLTGVLYVLGLVSLKFAMLATSNLFGLAPLSMKLRSRWRRRRGGRERERTGGDGRGQAQGQGEKDGGGDGGGREEEIPETGSNSEAGAEAAGAQENLFKETPTGGGGDRGGEIESDLEAGGGQLLHLDGRSGGLVLPPVPEGEGEGDEGRGKSGEPEGGRDREGLGGGIEEMLPVCPAVGGEGRGGGGGGSPFKEREEGGGGVGSRGRCKSSPLGCLRNLRLGCLSQRRQRPQTVVERKKKEEEKDCRKCADREREERRERERKRKGLMSAEEVERLVFSASAPATLLEEVPQLAVKVLFFVMIPEGQQILTLILGTALSAVALFLVLVRLLFSRRPAHAQEEREGEGELEGGELKLLKSGVEDFRSGVLQVELQPPAGRQEKEGERSEGRQIIQSAPPPPPSDKAGGLCLSESLSPGGRTPGASVSPPSASASSSVRVRVRGDGESEKKIETQCQFAERKEEREREARGGSTRELQQSGCLPDQAGDDCALRDARAEGERGSGGAGEGEGEREGVQFERSLSEAVSEELGAGCASSNTQTAAVEGERFR